MQKVKKVRSQTENRVKNVEYNEDYKKYNNLILSKIEHTLNIIIPAAVPLVVLMVINDYMRRNNLIMGIDSLIVIALLVITIRKKQISNAVKIAAIAFLTLIAGFASVTVAGVTGSGALTLLLGSILITGFLSKRISIFYAVFLVLSVCVFLVLVNHNIITYDTSNPKFNPNLIASWINPFIVFIICLMIIIIVINTIKRYFSISLKQTEEQLDYINHLAYYDALTDLPNKNKLLSADQPLLKDAGLIVLFSIDGYNLMDSVYGEAVTQEILLAISSLLSARNDNIVCYARTDVNEFAFVWKKNKEDEFLPFVEASIEEVQKHNKITKWNRGIHFHLGYFDYANQTIGILEAYKKAKIALQVARTNHAIEPVQYDEQIETLIKEEENVKHAVEEAITNNQFVIYYQEKVENQINQVVGVEALARWHSDERGLVSPHVFMPVIENSTLFSAFGSLVIGLVLKDYEKLCEKYSPDIKISINISPKYLLSQDFVNFIANDIDFNKVRAENIVFEITEETFIDNIDNAAAVITDIRKYGFKISLDDFGSGYSSLLYLSRIHFDEVKIDKSFIDQIATDPKIIKIIEIIAMLKDVYGFDLVAEGVETEEQYNILKKLGDFIIQGYYFSKPQKL